MSIAWERAYLAYLDSGLSKAEFYRTRLIEFSSDGCIYKLGYLYTNSASSARPSFRMTNRSSPRTTNPRR